MRTSDNSQYVLLFSHFIGMVYKYRRVIGKSGSELLCMLVEVLMNTTCLQFVVVEVCAGNVISDVGS